ncbi:hypothetical protein E1212_27075 [Jiangella ureilytica]|uniref:CU044_5270 family protein n=1 Tax=Jiangella ureilytica TaxID=2530374 RepID=A0A4R4RDD0_9ACTN|nr:CU044_5270 family protein [Jiangella ureilytica]TDC46373.1 hypothetical protein E1212_27075 [Jiangella ureilytica]
MSSTGMNLDFELPARRELPAERRDAIRRLLEDTVAGEVSARRLPRPRRRPRLRLALWPGAGLATAAAAAAAVLVVGTLGGGGDEVAHAATPPVLAAELARGVPADAELQALATLASSAPQEYAATEATVSTESWVMSVTETATGGAPAEGAAASLSIGTAGVTTAVVPVLREQRFLADGSVHVRETHGEARYPTAEWDESHAAAAGSVLLDETFPAGALASSYPSPLATDPTALREQLLAVWPQAEDPAAALFRALHEVSSTRPVDASVQAAALTMLAREPGVVALGETTDRSGRAALAFGADSADTGLDTRYVLMVDPATGRMLGYEEVLTGDTGALDLETPSVVAYTVFR